MNLVSKLWKFPSKLANTDARKLTILQGTLFIWLRPVLNDSHIQTPTHPHPHAHAQHTHTHTYTHNQYWYLVQLYMNASSLPPTNIGTQSGKKVNSYKEYLLHKEKKKRRKKKKQEEELGRASEHLKHM